MMTRPAMAQGRRLQSCPEGIPAVRRGVRPDVPEGGAIVASEAMLKAGFRCMLFDRMAGVGQPARRGQAGDDRPEAATER